MTASSPPTNSPAKVATASLVGTCLEYYDHLIFGTAAALVFPNIIFSQNNSRTALLMSLVLYGLAFIARPVGAVIFGHFGDRIGRKKVLSITLVLMGGGTFLIGALPTYASAGILAPIMLTLLRLIQGLALGGEWAGAAIMVSESGTQSKGLLGSSVQVASPIGFLLANLVFAFLVGVISEEDFLSWGWRLPFFASIALVIFGLYVRSSLAESPEFLDQHISQKSSRDLPITRVLRDHYGKLAVAVGARAGSDIAWYIFSLFLQIYVLHIGVPKSVALHAGIFGAITQVFAIPFFGYLADRWSSQTVLSLGAIAGIGWSFIFFQLVDTKDPLLIIIACVVGMFIQAALWAPLASFLPQMFPTDVRYSGAGLGFQLAGIVGGAFAPLIAISLLDTFDTSLSVAIYTAVALALVLVAVACVSRTSK